MAHDRQGYRKREERDQEMKKVLDVPVLVIPKPGEGQRKVRTERISRDETRAKYQIGKKPIPSVSQPVLDSDWRQKFSKEEE